MVGALRFDVVWWFYGFGFVVCFVRLGHARVFRVWCFAFVVCLAGLGGGPVVLGELVRVFVVCLAVFIWFLIGFVDSSWWCALISWCESVVASV